MNLVRNILLNPGPATTTETVKNALVVPDICPREQEFGDVLRYIERELTKIVAPPESHTTVLFAASGTGAVEACISSVVPDNGEILVIENGAYADRMAEIARRYYGPGRTHTMSVPFDGEIDLDVIESLLNGGPISHVAMVHHETSSGRLNPVREVGAIAHRHGVQLIVDGMSSFAGLPIDMVHDNIDYLIASSNKCIQGMAGMSFVVCARNLIHATRHHTVRNLYFNLREQDEHFQKTGQMRYTPPVQIAYALKQAIHEFIMEGQTQRYERYTRAWETLVTGMKELGFRTALKDEYQSKLLTTFFDPADANYSFNDMHDFLYRRGFTIYPGKISDNGTFRLANIGAIDHEDINNFLSVLNEYLGRVELCVS